MMNTPEEITPALEGFLPLDKPEGPSSHDVVARARRILRQRRVGHAGTLDPFATGLLILCLGPATRLAEYLQHGEKSYRFTLRLGVTTNTFDRTGTVTTPPGLRPPEDVSRGEIDALLPRFTGDIMQMPPIFSALKKDGRRLYEYARAGEEIQIAPRPVQIMSLSLLSWTPPLGEFEARVGGGTYIRSLGRDIGEALGTGACVETLRRTGTCGISLDNAVTLTALEEDPACAGTALLTPVQAFPHWIRAKAEGDALKRLLNGNAVSPADLEMSAPPDGANPILVLNAEGATVALGRHEPDAAGSGSGRIRPFKVLVNG